MANVVAGIVLDADWSEPLSGVTVYAFSTNGYTEGSTTTDSNGYFVLSGLTDRFWMAKLAADTVGNILLVPLDLTPPEHRDIRGVEADQHHPKVHFVEHHTGGDQALSLGLIAGTVTATGHGDQGTASAALHSIVGDEDADTLIQLEETADEDKIRFDTGGTERAVIDASGLAVTAIDCGGAITAASHVTVEDGNELRLYDNGNYVGFEAPALEADQIWVLPATDGDPDDQLTTDGDGTLSWAAAGAGAGAQDAALLDGDEHNDTAAAGPTRGDVIAADATPEWAALSPYEAGEYLRFDGTDAYWGLLTITDHDHSGDAGDGNTVSHDVLDDVSADDHHNEAHGIAAHTEHANWKVFHSDGSGDEQEVAVGADGTVFTGTAEDGAPEFGAADDHAHTSQSGITTVGTIGTGTWEGDAIDHERGGIEADISAVAIGDIVAGTGAGTMALVTSTGHDDGDVLTRQADGSVDFEAPAGGNGGGGGSDVPYCLTVEDPTSSEDVYIGFTKVAITVSEVRGVVVGSSPSVTINPKHSTDRSAAGNTLLDAATAITSTTTGDSITGASLDDVTIPANSHIWLETTAKSGTVDELGLAIIYDVD